MIEYGSSSPARTRNYEAALPGERRGRVPDGSCARSPSGSASRRSSEASRARIVAAETTKRQESSSGILHDGAQQRLVSLSLSLRLARAGQRATRGRGALLEASREELAQALRSCASSHAGSIPPF
jgi:hypothetical protein